MYIERSEKLNKKYPEMTVFCVNHTRCRYKYCVGYCSNQLHRGYLSKRLLEEHKCLEKECRYLKKIHSNSYWRKKEKKEREKTEIKRIRKERKDIEKSIIECVPEGVEILLCKYLYDKTYFLIIQSNTPISYNYFKDLPVHVYIKNYPFCNKNNLDVTYHLLLPEEMREKHKQFKQNK